MYDGLSIMTKKCAHGNLLQSDSEISCPLTRKSRQVIPLQPSSLKADNGLVLVFKFLLISLDIPG